jgi:protein tyrosine phosphatase (PTP) superfamily phosphohydrolase (DUF442 family)
MLGACVGLLLVVAVRALHVFAAGNVHEVIPGQAYRTAQLSPGELEKLLRRKRIRTVVNLRGCCANFEWYQNESRVTHNCGVAQEDICLSSGRLPSAGEIRRLVDVIDTSEYPMVFHCHRGIDRTGLATTMLLLLRTETPLDSARTQLGFHYGHLAFGRTGLLDRFFDLYAEWLAEHGLNHSSQTFRRWARQEYYPAECWAKLELIQPITTVEPNKPFGLPVRVTNTSPKPWRLRSTRVTGIHLHYVVCDLTGKTVATGFAGLFEAEVLPGQSLDLTVALPSLPPGRYRLAVDMEEAGHSLFAQTGSEPLEQELIIGD